MAEDKILIVDDDSEILKSFRRRFAKKLDVYVAEGVEEALNLVHDKGPFAVVVSDYRMPVMNGVDLLARIKKDFPDTVRILLTGFADLKTAMDGVNQGNIFRLLSKPCPPDVMTKSLVEAIKQYRLVALEHELLQDTLHCSIQVLTELLSLTKPDAFGRASRLESISRKLALIMGVSPLWEVEVAAELSQLGLAAFPPALIRKINIGKRLSPEEQKLFNSHPITAAELICNIPRLDAVANIVLYQEKNFDGSGVPDDSISGEQIPPGARILKLAIDCDVYMQSGYAPGQALRALNQKKENYDPEALKALSVLLSDESRFTVREVSIMDLGEKMILADDLYSISPSRKLLSKGHEITSSVLHYIDQLRRTIGVQEPVKVIEPLEI